MMHCALLVHLIDEHEVALKHGVYQLTAFEAAVSHLPDKFIEREIEDFIGLLVLLLWRVGVGVVNYPQVCLQPRLKAYGVNPPSRLIRKEVLIGPSQAFL